ncbi:hypothetical protein [Roseovarius nanhaiticus]|uniref:Uncharacterized protein n=1 Tax=Roseovarius nanhaiticus TaxID=573024 RepID=A0A1N7FV13_9RHOB|nr:hypothetical protein [Roseovarius nanhaiticus]SEK44536.1 hypothetical protein SAMN05216208_0735 [Roseovarius nanhaiticus]SIS04213.1 hypothetical protein SAMN05421666_1401 [Roseovarius nanhaiticus]
MILIVAALALMACDTPGPAFRGVEPVRIGLRGDVFDVRVDGVQAQAMRLNARWAPNLDSVAPNGVLAIEEVSGCRVRKLYGDAALMTARLDCGQKLEPLPRGFAYDCDVYKIFDGLAELDCRPNSA